MSKYLNAQVVLDLQGRDEEPLFLSSMELVLPWHAERYTR